MERKIVSSLFSLFIFLAWLFCGVYVSSGEEWWTVLYIEQTNYDTFTASVSISKVSIGALISIFLGAALYACIRKR